MAQDHLLAPNYRQLQDLVERIPNPSTNGWHEMVQMGYAIKASDEAAPAIFLEWCDRWEGGVSEPEMNVANWESFLPPFQIGWPWLQDQAQEAGEYSVAVDTFDADPDAEEPEEDEEEEGDPQAGQITFTDEWAVNKLLPYIRKRLRYVQLNRQWYFWEGHIWTRDETLAHERWIRKLLYRLSLRLWDQASAIEGDEAKPFRAAAKKYQSGDAIARIIRLTKAQIPTVPTDFDKDLLTLNTPGGPVDLRTGEMSDPDPEGMLSRSVLVEPKDGPAPRWDKFMKDLTGSDPDLIRYLQKLVGYTLTGDVSAKTLWFLWGSDTDTGKSTFIRIVSKLLHTYADSVDVSVFINGKGSRSESLARLPGVRLVTSTEPQAGHAWDEKRIKAITGGDDIEARALYGHPFVYTPQFKIIIVGNQEPAIKNVDDAMLRRIRIVPINIRVAEKDKIDNLAEELVEEEGPQILAWFIRGCLLQREEGFDAPAVVAARTKEYELAEDSLAEWVEEECDLGDDYSVARQALYHAWTVWSLSRGEEPGGLKAFKRRVDARFHFEDKKVGPETRRLAGFKGIQLKPRVAAGTQEF